MKRKALIMCMLLAISITGCNGGSNTENLTENTAEEKTAEKEIEKAMEDKYDADFEVFYITKVDAGDIEYACYAHADGDEESQVSINRLSDGSIQDNYAVLQYKAGIEDMILQSSTGLTVFTAFEPNVVQLVEDKEYKDLDDYVKNGNYSVSIRAEADMETSQDDIIKGVTSFAQAISEFGLKYSIEVNEYMTFDFSMDRDEEITEDYVRENMYVDETRKADYEERMKEEAEMLEEDTAESVPVPEDEVLLEDEPMIP